MVELLGSKARVGNSFWLAGHIGNSEKELLAVHFQKGSTLRGILMFYQAKKLFKVLGGPHVARGPDVAHT